MGQILFAAFEPAVIAWAACRTARVFGRGATSASFFKFWLSSAVGETLAFLVPPVLLTPELAAAVNVLLAALLWWWWCRKDRKRTLDAIGAKSAALLAALLDRMRETLQSRPGLQPVPAGAGFRFQDLSEGLTDHGNAPRRQDRMGDRLRRR